MRITQHSKQRIIERDDQVSCVAEAKRTAKIAFSSGKTIGEYQKYPDFFSYLHKKRTQTNECSIRIYRGNIYIWRGRNHTLVTAHPVPDRFQKYMEDIKHD